MTTDGEKRQMKEEGAGIPTPPSVVADLVAAFGSSVGETGYEVEAAKCCLEQEKIEARQRGSSLLYGELLPDAVTKSLQATHLGGALSGNENNGLILELGMGSGKVALQMFLQCLSARRVFGVELVTSRFQLAEKALKHFTGIRPELVVTKESPGDHLCIQESSSGRLLEFWRADFFDTGLHLVTECDIIFFAVNIPCRLFPQLCQRLATAKDGCRIFTYHTLADIWWTTVPCPFHQVDANIPESDMFSTSWSPQGFKFYVYVCDRKREPLRHGDSRHETFSEWKVMWDESAQGYFFHNEESEISQWELPTQVGCWQALYSDEHAANFFHHIPSGHTQWEAPKCLADLGWTDKVEG
jgi:hypothetical protein